MSFSDKVAAFAKKAKTTADKEFGKSVLALYVDIVRGTPVDTGVLKNNWQFGVNTTNGEKLSAPGSVQAVAPIAQRGAKAAKGLTISDTAIIFNNMEYAAVIENGLAGTRRIPARMVAKAILAARARNI